MSKKEVLISKLNPIIDNSDKLEKFLIDNSNLPGPRANLELAFGFAEIYDDLNVLLKWINISEDEAENNDPRSFLVFCSAVCLGKIYAKTKDNKIIAILKQLANDGRWRIREAVTFGFQHIGEDDFSELKNIISHWIKKSNNFEKRAILVSLAHNQFLSEEISIFCFEITEIVLNEMDRINNFTVLRKGLEFTISVFVAANPKLGFNFLRRWIGKDKVVDKIIKENLNKNRLFRTYPDKVERLIRSI